MIYTDWAISIVLAFIMLAVGLSLTTKDFKALASRPLPVIVGIVLQLLLLPAIAFSIATIWDLPAAFQVGIVILAATPGGMTSNFISYLFNANTALAVSLTVCNSILTIFTVPLIVNWGLTHFYGELSIYTLPFVDTAIRIFGIVLLPVLAGILFRAKKPQTAAKLQLGFRWLSMVLLALIFIIKAFAPTSAGGSELSSEDVAMILPASLAVNFSALLIGRLVAWLCGYGRDEQLTLGVEVGIQNTSLAFLIAGTILGNQDMLKPALIYATFSFLTAVVYGLWVKPKEWNNLKEEFSTLKSKYTKNT